MQLSITAEKILTKHREQLHREFELAKSLARQTGASTGEQHFEVRLRQRMLKELAEHAERAGKAHHYYWERLHRHATPKHLAGLIEEAKADADSKEYAETRAEEEKNSVEDRLRALEDHVFTVDKIAAKARTNYRDEPDAASQHRQRLTDAINKLYP